ncbi:MAG: hypothetical protein IJV37_03705 [Bacteroidales bacterium]|nr:hypothetical protein [Bacteroidales bacterium]
MKRLFPTTLLLLLLSVCLSAQDGSSLRERVYLATDREVYVAGDAVWLSAYCVDASTGRLSAFSKTAYVELHSAQGLAGTAKIALDGGRGAGRLFLSGTLPTGNYRMLAYTALGAAEPGFDSLTGVRTLSVFNTLSAERIPDGVRVVGQVPAAQGYPTAGSLELSAESGRITVANHGREAVSFSLAVRHADGIPAPPGDRMADFIRGVRSLPAGAGAVPGRIPEYEGEIIWTRVSGADARLVRSVRGKVAFLSSPGDGENVYTATIADDGTATFYTANIYGEQEMFLEIEDLSREQVCHLEVVSPFADFPVGEIPQLALCPDYAPALRLRSLGMQLGRNFDADTLLDALPVRIHTVLNGQERKSYVLDDYRRFPVMEELFVEFIPELRVRRIGERPELQVRMRDVTGNLYFPQGTALVMLDGIPVSDHGKILSYDPLLVRRIDIDPSSVFLGIRRFSGVVNFVTYKGTLPSMQFEDNVRIVDFQGCSLPLAFTGSALDENYPDYRQTLLWQPLLKLEPGQQLELNCKMPAYSGAFEAVAEGLSDSGEAVSTKTAVRTDR